MALCWALWSVSYSNAQDTTVSATTGNLISNNNWSGVVPGVDPNDCCSNPAGSGALYDSPTNTIKFSYGLSTVSQTVALQQALGGTGIQVSGYNYSFDYRLTPNSGLHTDYLAASVWLTTAAGLQTEATHLNLNGQVAAGVNDQWNTASGSRNFASSYLDPQSLTIRFEGRDGGFWAGLYGPEIKNVSLTASYSVDLCALNPLYASHCAGFNDIVSSGNLVSHPGAIATWGQGLNQTFNIATALEHSGSGVTVHGINYGLDAYVGDTYCALSDPLFGICFDNRDPDLSVTANLKDSLGNSLYSVSRKGEYDNKPYWQTYNYSYVLPQSRNSLTLGDFEFTAQTRDQAGVMNMYANVLYTKDPCVEDPLFSSSCPGYFQALQALIPATAPTTTEPTAVADASPTAAVDPVAASSDPVAQTQTVAAAGSQTAVAAEPAPAPTQSAPQQTAATAPQESQSAQQKKSGPSLSQIQSIVGGELSRISQLESKTVSETVAQAEAAAQSAVDQAESVAGSLTEQSIQGSIEQAQSSIAQTQAQSQSSANIAATVTQGSQGPAAAAAALLQSGTSSDSSASGMPEQSQNQSNLAQQAQAESQSQPVAVTSQPQQTQITAPVTEIAQPELPQPPQTQAQSQESQINSNTQITAQDQQNTQSRTSSESAAVEVAAPELPSPPQPAAGQPQDAASAQNTQVTAQDQQSTQGRTTQEPTVVGIAQPELPPPPQTQAQNSQPEPQSVTTEQTQPQVPQTAQTQISQPSSQAEPAQEFTLPTPPQPQTAGLPESQDTQPQQMVMINTQPQISLPEPTAIPQPEIKAEEVMNPLYSLLPPRPQPVLVPEPEPEPQRSGPAVLSNTPRAEQAADRPQITDSRPQAQPGPAVNRSVANNEAAGGVDLAAIAVQPQGFSAYTTALADAAFYAPKEIYKNQKTVDNQRAARFLNAASDRLHQQMVDQQYQGAK